MPEINMTGFERRIAEANPGLKRVIPCNQADVSTTHDEQLFCRQGKVAVDQRLKCTGAEDPWQGVAFKREEFFTCAGRHQQHLRADKNIVLAIF